MPNTPYSNFFLSNEVEDQYNSHLDLQNFCTVDNNLEGTAGMVRKINVYSGSGNTQKLTKGNGNTSTITVGYTQKTYTIALAQNMFQYYDEDAMEDPLLVPTGVQYAGTSMFNTVNADAFAEFNKANRVVVVSALDFDAFADAQSMLNIEELEGVEQFAFVNPADVAALRKALKNTLQYVEAWAKNGYIGTVAGVNVYTKKDAVKGTIVVATKEAVTIFNKKGVEVEQAARCATDGNTRTNTIFSRKYYVAAMTNQTKAVKILKGTAALSTDTTVSSSKTYYAASGLGYIEVTPAGTENPTTEGWYEITLS